MSTEKKYLFTSERLGFRNWIASDTEPLAAMNADPECMAFFPAVQSMEQTKEFISKMQHQLMDKGFCYFAVDALINNEFIGFIGISEQTYEADFTPCTDIGWRLKVSAWNKGYATEGALRCIEYGREVLHLKKIMSVAPQINLRSIAVMKKVGMKKVKNFHHPLLKGNERLEECELYEINF